MPDYDARPTGKTLLDIAQERLTELEKDPAFPHIQAENGEDESMFTSTDSFPPFATAVLYGFSLSMLHITLDVLVLTQYSQDIIWLDILTRLARMLPALLLLLYFAHLPSVLAWRQTRQAVFFASSIAAGCYLLYSGNVYGYYFVMKRAPQLGTLWVWSVVEMDVFWAVGHVVVVGAYAWWNGFGAF